MKCCIKCGEEKELDSFVKDNNYADGRRNMCKQCYSKYMIDYYKSNPEKKSKHKDKEIYNKKKNLYMKARWEKRRVEAMKKLGDCCIRCGITKHIEFDHIDTTTKIMTVARAASRSDDFFWAEVAKCQLLCRACHLEKTAEDFRKRHSEDYTAQALK